jgi:SUMO ligase MMS21 Smc5/6 complex component
MLLQAITAMEDSMQLQTPQQKPSDEADAVPVDMLCPITLKLLEDPVILADSAQTYEREAIQEWLDRGNRKDPVSGGPSVRVLAGSLLIEVSLRIGYATDMCCRTVNYYWQ